MSPNGPRRFRNPCRLFCATFQCAFPPGKTSDPALNTEITPQCGANRALREPEASATVQGCAQHRWAAGWPVRLEVPSNRLALCIPSKAGSTPPHSAVDQYAGMREKIKSDRRASAQGDGQRLRLSHRTSQKNKTDVTHTLPLSCHPARSNREKSTREYVLYQNSARPLSQARRKGESHDAKEKAQNKKKFLSKRQNESHSNTGGARSLSP